MTSSDEKGKNLLFRRSSAIIMTYVIRYKNSMGAYRETYSKSAAEFEEFS